MTEETAITKLDYSEPPPGYQTSGRFWGFTGGTDFELRSGRDDAPARSCLARSALGIAAAWADHKAHNDPPGMHTSWAAGDGTCLPLGALVEARATAWAWHDRRLALAARLPVNADPWPRCLRWTDKECDQVDRWIADGEETAEPLWSLPPGGAAIVWPDNTPAPASMEDPDVGALLEQHQREAQAPPTTGLTVRPLVLGEWEVRVGGVIEPGVVYADDEQEALAQAAVQLAEDEVGHIRRELASAEQKLQRARAQALKSSTASIDAFLAKPNLHPSDLADAKATIPHGSIRCAHWDDHGRMVWLGLQLGEGGPGLWLKVSRQELGYHAEQHAADLVSRGVADALQRQVEQAHALAGEAFTARDKLQLEVERLGRVQAATPDVVFEALRVADAEVGRLREVMHRMRDDLEGDLPEPASALARLAEVLE